MPSVFVQVRAAAAPAKTEEISSRMEIRSTQNDKVREEAAIARDGDGVIRRNEVGFWSLGLKKRPGSMTPFASGISG